MTEDEVKLCKTISKLTGILYEACEENRELKETIKSQREQITQLNAELKKGGSMMADKYRSIKIIITFTGLSFRSSILVLDSVGWDVYKAACLAKVSGEAVVRFNEDGTRKGFGDYVREVMEGKWDCIDKDDFEKFIKDNNL